MQNPAEQNLHDTTSEVSVAGPSIDCTRSCTYGTGRSYITVLALICRDSGAGTLGTFDILVNFHFISLLRFADWRARLTSENNHPHQYVFGHHVAPAEVRKILPVRKER